MYYVYNKREELVTLFELEQDANEYAKTIDGFVESDNEGFDDEQCQCDDCINGQDKPKLELVVNNTNPLKDSTPYFTEHNREKIVLCTIS